MARTGGIAGRDSTRRTMFRAVSGADSRGMPTAPAPSRRHLVEDTLIRAAFEEFAVTHLAGRLPGGPAGDDVARAAMAGLAQAARSYDPARHRRFDDYASARVRHALGTGRRQGDDTPEAPAHAAG